jgi:hypothetical protein
MAYDLAYLKRKRVIEPPRILIYGPEGVGKTSYGAYSPNPIFLPVEEGLVGMPDIPSFDLIRNFDALQEAMIFLADEEHDFQTAVLDSLDWLERLVWDEACKRNKWENIRAPGYGEGYAAALEVWRLVLDMFEAIRHERKMAFIFIAHAAIVNYKDPENPAYDVFQPKLHVSGKGVGANPLIAEAVDAIFFLNKAAAVTKEQTPGAKKGESRARAIGGQQRTIRTDGEAAFKAKNRWNMPASINLSNDPKLSFDTVAQFIPYYSQHSNPIETTQPEATE